MAASSMLLQNESRMLLFMTGKRVSAAELLCLSQNSRRSRLLGTIRDSMIVFGTSLSPKRGGRLPDPYYATCYKMSPKKPPLKVFCEVRSRKAVWLLQGCPTVMQ